MPISQMEGYFKNSYFKRTYALSVDFKKSVFYLYWNPEKSNHSSLSNWWITFFKHLYSLIMWQYTEFNWLCKHRKKVRSRQAYISINSCTELTKTKVFPVSLSQSKYSFESKNFLRGLHALNPLLRGSEPPALLMLAFNMCLAGSYDIHPRHNKMACD